MIPAIHTHAAPHFKRTASHDRPAVGKSWRLDPHPSPHRDPRQLVTTGVVDLGEPVLQVEQGAEVGNRISMKLAVRGSSSRSDRGSRRQSIP
jgi:hypothetical protein